MGRSAANIIKISLLVSTSLMLISVNIGHNTVQKNAVRVRATKFGRFKCGNVHYSIQARSYFILLYIYLFIGVFIFLSRESNCARDTSSLMHHCIVDTRAGAKGGANPPPIDMLAPPSHQQAYSFEDGRICT